MQLTHYELVRMIRSMMCAGFTVAFVADYCERRFVAVNRAWAAYYLTVPDYNYIRVMR